jgi:hypothetical protein
MPDAAARVRSAVGALAAEALGAARGEDDLAALLAAIEGEVARELEADPARGPPPACGPGCAACCTVNVATLAVEGIAAARLLRERLGPGAIPLAARLRSFHDRVRWLEDRERIADRLACPLGDAGGLCTIHPARPLACRALTSLDAADCRAAVAVAGEDAGLVRMDLLQHALYGEAFDALAGALSARGLDARPRDVSGMTACFLADPSRVDAWLSGGRLPLD